MATSVRDVPKIVEFGPTFRDQLGSIAVATDGSVWVQEGDGAAHIDLTSRIVQIPSIDNCNESAIPKLSLNIGEAWMSGGDRILEFRGSCIVSRAILPPPDEGQADSNSYLGFVATPGAVYYSAPSQLGITRLTPNGETENLYANTGNVASIVAGNGYLWMSRLPRGLTAVDPAGIPHDVKLPRLDAQQTFGTNYAVATDGSLIFDVLISSNDRFGTPKSTVIEKISTNGTVTVLGSVARTLYEDSVAAIAATGDGSVWTSEPNENHLVRFGADGTAHVIRDGFPMGAEPNAIVADTADPSCVWVTDSWGASVYYVCESGSVRQIGNGLSPLTMYGAPRPQSDGSVIFPETLGWHRRTARIDRNGKIREEAVVDTSTATQTYTRMALPGRNGKVRFVPIPVESETPDSDAPPSVLGPDGNTWSVQTLADAIVRADSSNRRTIFRKGLTRDDSGPQYLTRDPDGALWFTEVRSRVGRISMDGKIREFSAGIPRRSFLGGIVAGCDGNLWFTMYHGNELARITPSGVVTRFRDGIFPSRGNDDNVPDSIPAVDSRGRIWFNESQGGRIARATIVCR